MLKYSTVLVLFLLVFSSCRKEPNYPDEPEIEFVRVEQYHFEENRIKRDSLIMVVHFQDGDGNLGLSSTNPEDETPPFDRGSPYYNNFIVNLLIRRQNPDGTHSFVPYQFPVAGFNLSGRFPRLSNDERQEPLEGEIKYSLNLSSDIFRVGDVVKFEVFIYDRTRPVPNKSNTAISEEVTLFQP